MKKILFLLVPIFLMAITVLFISCDYLIPAPLGRNNPFDDEAQIGRFAVVVSGPDSVVTAWDWRDPPSGIDKSRIIDKIRIVYSESDPPLSKYPINPDNVIEFTSNSDFSYEWKNLNEDRDHYFALYAHEKGGMWLAPKRVDIWIENNGYEDRWNIAFQKFGVNTSAGTNTVQTLDFQVSDVPPLKIGFIRFDELNNYGYGIVLDARIFLDLVVTNGDMFIVPVRKQIEEGMTWNQISDGIFYDYKNALLVNITGPTQYIDIKNQINISRLYGSNTLALIPGPSSLVDINLLDLEFWDMVDTTFSVWRNN